MRVLRGVAGRTLDCGCLVGVYETYAGEVVTIVDARGAGCPQPAHRAREVVDVRRPDKTTRTGEDWTGRLQ